jgi:hypothetical protein
MKKVILVLAAVSLLGFSSCEKNDSETPGKIPGLGDTPGELQISKRFVLPEGISVVGEITGVENSGSKGELKSLLINDIKSSIPHYGSGCVVRLKLTLLNSRNHPRTVFFPKGLIFKCINGAYQHGLCCQIFWVTLAPNEKRTAYIDVYCGNLGIPAPDEDGKYAIWGVTSSKVLWDLLNKVGWKKINFEWIYHNTLGKGMMEAPTYEEITQKLQTMVHNLTNNGIGISAEDEAFLNTIPELDPSLRPAVDANSQYPEYFEEIIVPEK